MSARSDQSRASQSAPPPRSLAGSSTAISKSSAVPRRLPPMNPVSVGDASEKSEKAVARASSGFHRKRPGSDVASRGTLGGCISPPSPSPLHMDAGACQPDFELPIELPSPQERLEEQRILEAALGVAPPKVGIAPVRSRSDGQSEVFSNTPLVGIAPPLESPYAHAPLVGIAPPLESRTRTPSPKFRERTPTPEGKRRPRERTLTPEARKRTPTPDARRTLSKSAPEACEYTPPSAAQQTLSEHSLISHASQFNPDCPNGYTRDALAVEPAADPADEPAGGATSSAIDCKHAPDNELEDAQSRDDDSDPDMPELVPVQPPAATEVADIVEQLMNSWPLRDSPGSISSRSSSSNCEEDDADGSGSLSRCWGRGELCSALRKLGDDDDEG